MSLPGLLGEIEKIAGTSVATRLALHAGGTEMKFSPKPRGALARIVGVEAARQIAAALGSEKYTIPMAHLRGARGRRARAAEMLADGRGAGAVAKSVDVHERTIWRLKEKIRKKGKLPLFPDS